MKWINVYTHTNEGTSAKCIMALKGEDGESLANLRVSLEGNKDLKLEFQYKDPNECYKVATNIGFLNDLEDKVFVTHALCEEVKDLACKWQRLRDEYDFMDII